MKQSFQEVDTFEREDLIIQNDITLSILLPVRNEPESVAIIVKVLNALVEVPHELVIITDDPNDTTIPIINTLTKRFLNVKHVSNQNGIGVLNAVRAGVSEAKGKYILIYAADEIGPVLSIKNMLNLLDLGCDLVSGTRYAKGGKRYGGSFIGHILSRTANSLFNLLSATVLTDCTTGLKMFRKSIFDNFNLKNSGKGWSFAFQMAISAQVLGYNVGETPIVSIDRLFGGKSTFRLLPWALSYAKCFIMGLRKLPFWHKPKPKYLDFSTHQHSI